MKPMFSPLFAALLLAAGASSASEPPQEPLSHGAHDVQPAHAAPVDHDDRQQAPIPAVRWQADEPLARGMQRVRAATHALSHGAHGHLDEAQVQAIARRLDSAVKDMFAQCRLDPAPDAALHPLLASVLKASATLSKGRFDSRALSDLEAVLARYPTLFEDATWSSPSDASEDSISMPLRSSQPRSNSVSS